MEIGLYGVHSCNMDKMKITDVSKRLKFIAILYFSVVFFTFFMPQRIITTPFDEKSTRTLAWTDEGKYKYSSKDKSDESKFFRFRQLIEVNHDYINYEVLISELKALEFEVDSFKLDKNNSDTDIIK